MKRILLPSLIVVAVLAVVAMSWQQLSMVEAPPTSDSASSVLGIQTPLSHTYRINIPTVIRELLTTLALTVEGDTLIGGSLSVAGPVSFSNASVFDGAITITSNINARGITMDLGNGRIIASNLVSSIQVGEGLSLAGTTSTPLLTNTDLGSSQPIYKTIKVGDSTTTANSNSDTLSFSQGSGIELSLSDDTVTITATTPTTAITSSGSYAVFSSGITRLGLGTNTPSNTLEVDPGTTNTSGITLTQLTSSSPVGVGGGKVLSVDSGGKIILVEDQTSTAAEDVLPITSTGGTLYFNGTNWVGSTNLYHNGGNVGISTDNPLARLHILTNSAGTVGLSVQGAASQTGDLLRFLNSDGDTMSFFDKDGIFNGSANLSGSFNPGLTTGAVTFQGSSGLTGDASNLFWDNSTKRLGIGTASPGYALDVGGSVRATGSFYALGTDGFRILTSGGTFRGQFSDDGTITSIRGAGVGSGAPNIALDSSRNVGIGVTSMGSKLVVKGSGVTSATSALNVTNSADTSMLFVRDDGNVGIGTASPNQRLELSSGHMQIYHDQNIYGGLNSTGNRDRAYLQLYSGTRGNVTLSSYNATIFDSNLSAFSSDNSYEFRKAGSAQMVISTNGLVGIGTTSPTAQLHLASTATSLSANGLSYLNWNPGSVATFVGDLVGINIGSNGTITGNIFNITDNGSSLFSVSESKITSSLPHEFLSAGDVSFGYDLQFTNTTSASIKSLSSLYLEAGPSYGSNDVVLKTFNSGNVVIDSRSLNIGGSTARGLLTVDNTYRPLTGKALVSLNQVENQDILTASASGTTRFVIKADGKVGVGTNNPAGLLDVSRDTDQTIYLGRGVIDSRVSDYVYFSHYDRAGDATSFALRQSSAGATVLNSDGGQGLAFTIDNGNSGSAVLSSSGFFGVGTYAPTSKIDITTNSLGVTQTADSGVALVNNTVAADGLQQVSPAVRWTGQGWKTAATAASQTVDFQAYLLPVQATNAPVGQWILRSAVNGSAYTNNLIINSSAGLTEFLSTGVRLNNPGGNPGGISLNGSAPVSNRLYVSPGFSLTNSSTPSPSGSNVITFTTTESYATSGSTNITQVTGSFAPTTGTGLLTGMYLEPAINQTGGANGITRGIYINPTLTAAADWRSLEISNNSGFGIYQSGSSATNYLAGNLGIGTTSPSTKLHVRAEGTTGSIATFESDNNTGCTISDGGVIACSSDQRLKDNISPLTNGLSVISSLSPSTFTWKNSPGQTQAGFIAQAVDNILPNLVYTNSNGFKSLSMTGMVPYLVKAIQEQQGQINSLSSTQVLGVSTTEGLTTLLDQYQRLSDKLASLSPFETWLTLMSSIFSADDDTLLVRLATKFESDVSFEGRVSYEDKDMGGWLEFEAGADRLEYHFETPFDTVPLVQLTPMAPAEYYLEDLTTEGFVVRLAQPTSELLRFAWTVTVVVDPSTSVALPSPVATPQTTTQPTPQPSPLPSSESSHSATSQ